MNTNMTNLFPTTLCNASLVEEMTEAGLANGYVTPEREHCGYALINDRLVPETFIQRVMAEFDECVFDYGVVLSKEHLFDAEFLESLDEFEHQVLMPVVLLLVARDKFPLNLWAACLQEDDCEVA